MDANLRKLARAAESGEYVDIAAYWYALLKAGELPAPTYDFLTWDKVDAPGSSREGGGRYSERWAGWTILCAPPEDEFRHGHRIWQVQVTLGRADSYTVNSWEKSNSFIGRPPSTYMDWREAEQDLKERILEMLRKYDDAALRARIDEEDF